MYLLNILAAWQLKVENKNVWSTSLAELNSLYISENSELNFYRRFLIRSLTSKNCQLPTVREASASTRTTAQQQFYKNSHQPPKALLIMHGVVGKHLSFWE